MSKLFYSLEIRMIPLRMLFVIPKGYEPSKVKPQNLDLFCYDNTKHQLLLNKDLEDYLVGFPHDRFDYTTTLTNPYKLQLRELPSVFNKEASLESIRSKTKPGKITAVYNIPKSERIRQVKPGSNESFIDSVIKVPQHGKVGYYSMKVSTIDLSYNIYGELKKMSAEKKTSLDTDITSGATASKDLLTALKKQGEKTELELLEEKAKTLELMKKIRELENAEE